MFSVSGLLFSNILPVVLVLIGSNPAIRKDISSHAQTVQFHPILVFMIWIWSMDLNTGISIQFPTQWKKCMKLCTKSTMHVKKHCSPIWFISIYIIILCRNVLFKMFEYAAHFLSLSLNIFICFFSHMYLYIYHTCIL